MTPGEIIAVGVVAVLLTAFLLFLLVLWIMQCYEKRTPVTTTEDGESRKVPLNEMRQQRKVEILATEVPASSESVQFTATEVKSSVPLVKTTPAKRVESDGHSYFQSLQHQLKGVKSVSDYQKK